MIKEQHKPFTRTELKILVYNRMKQHGMSYDDAINFVRKEIDTCNKSHKHHLRSKNKDKGEKFKEEFKKLGNKKKR